MADGRTYEVDVPDGISLEQGLADARAKARGVGIALVGGIGGGSFSGTAEGRYEVEGRRLRLVVTKKPSFVPWALVESGLRQVFGDVEPA